MARNVIDVALPQAARRRLIGMLQGTRHAAGDEVFVSQGDVILGLDSFWSTANDGERRFRLAADSGATVALIVYDLIPLTHPQFCDELHHKTFPPGMAHAISSANVILPISKYVLTTIDTEFPGVTAAARVLPLASSPLPIVGSSLPMQHPVFLMVGTVEPRKNHLQVLEWWQQRTQSGTLAIVGRSGWKNEQIVGKIAELQANGVIWDADCDDPDLANYYATADAVIAASYVEGYGLPLAESLARGIPLIASDIPVFREVAGGAAEYFEIGDVESLEAAASRAIAAGRQPAPASVRTWDDVAADIILALPAI